MLIKVAVLFVLVMMGLALFGRVRLGRKPPKPARYCATCGRPRIGPGPCGCESGRGG